MGQGKSDVALYNVEEKKKRQRIFKTYMRTWEIKQEGPNLPDNRRRFEPRIDKGCEGGCNAKLLVSPTQGGEA